MNWNWYLHFRPSVFWELRIIIINRNNLYIFYSYTYVVNHFALDCLMFITTEFPACVVSIKSILIN